MMIFREVYPFEIIVDALYLAEPYICFRNRDGIFLTFRIECWPIKIINIMDIAKRNLQNPILKPSDLKPGIEGMEIVCLLNPGVFRTITCS